MERARYVIRPLLMLKKKGDECYLKINSLFCSRQKALEYEVIVYQEL